ncbi:hypothetical protein [Streptomyces sp. NPDC005017]|uniref:hypothetical protein n=1 Tax=Streptomyces sp. NPDC005017 TaxID=3364706 RepID=UPI0036C50227
MARRRLRGAAVAAGLTGVLVLSGCTDDGQGNGEPTPGATSPSASATPDGGATPAAGDTLEGTWLTTSEGSAVGLVVTGEQAALFGSKGMVCSGSASAGSIRLTCTTGGDDRALGTVDSVDGTTLKVTWEGRLGQETYQRAEGGKLPSGFPTGGLG